MTEIETKPVNEASSYSEAIDAAAKKNDTESVQYEQEITLPSGKRASLLPFVGKDIREAQKLAGKDDTMLGFAIISATVHIDGKKVWPDEIDLMPGRDVMALLKLTGENFS